MRVGLIAPPWVSVPPPAYGGTEGVIDRLARGMHRAGHEVRLFTVEESTCPVPRRWWHSRPIEPIGDAVAEAAHVLAAYEELDDVDVVHDHTTLGPLLARRRRPRSLVVTTIHSPFTRDTRRIYRQTAASVPLLCISEQQRASAPEIPVAGVIHHGIDAELFPPGDGAGGYLLFLGRMSPDKGVDRAAVVARAAGVRLLIAAKMREPAELAYFEEHVRPLLGGGVEYVGEVGTGERLRLLQHASALLNPIRWAEPFGLVMIESLACGTPVIAQAVGAATEIIDDGTTGYLCTDEEEIVRAIGRIGTLDRAACREAVLRRFSTEKMVREHLSLFAELLAERERPRRDGGSPVGLAWNRS